MADKFLAVHKTASHNSESAPNARRVEVEKPWGQQNPIHVCLWLLPDFSKMNIYYFGFRKEKCLKKGKPLFLSSDASLASQGGGRKESLLRCQGKTEEIQKRGNKQL